MCNVGREVPDSGNEMDEKQKRCEKQDDDDNNMHAWKGGYYCIA